MSTQEKTLPELVAMLGGRITGDIRPNECFTLRPVSKTLRQLWAAPLPVIHDLEFQKLALVLWEKTRYTVERAGKMIPGFWDMTPAEACKAVIKHHDEMKRREGETFWKELWDMQRKHFLES